jgi:ABC-2 type transport system permease protein
VIIALVENEMLKMLRRKRFRVVLLILAAIAALAVFGRWKSEQRARLRSGAAVSGDWRARTQHRIVELRNRLRRPEIPDGPKRWMRAESARLQYSLDHGFDPEALNGPAFSRAFLAVSSYLLLPLLVTVFASDLVSSELTEGTIKLLLTRPARRWKILLAKVLALFSCVTLTVVLAGILSYAFAGIAFGWRGWGMPVLAGFRFRANAELDFSSVRQIPLWRDALRVYGLGWFSALAVSCLALFLSVCLRTAAAMGTMIAALVAGTILPRVASDWDFSRFIFVTNLPLPDYYSGSPPPLPGMSLAFSTGNLAAWAAAALVAAFAVFLRRDVLG